MKGLTMDDAVSAERRVRHWALILVALLVVGHLASPVHADPLKAAAEARTWRQSHELEIVERFRDLLHIPNVASDRVNIRRNAEHIAALLADAGLTTELLELPDQPEANPAVFGELLVPGAERTVLIYVHYDGQPVDRSAWASDPWTPILRTDLVENGGTEIPFAEPLEPDWRIFARSAGDDKAPIVALHGALTALTNAGMTPTVNLKVFLDGEEEAGSPNLRAMLERHKAKLASDLWLFCDGPMHQSRRWQLVYGVRGAVGFDLTVFGASRPLHSGHYGNWAPNPIMELVSLIGTMRAPDGRILVEGIHDQVRPLTDAERAAIAASPRMDERLTDELGIGRPETDDRIEVAIARPGMNLQGIVSGGVGPNARNAIQTSATANIGLRLVPDQTPTHLRDAIVRHVEAQGYTLLPAGQQTPTARDRERHDRLARLDWPEGRGYPAYRADMAHPLARELSAVLNRLSDDTLIQTPTMGGSLPIFVVEEVLETPVLIVPIANHDNNQHGANENLRLQNLWDAIEIYAAALTGL
jgi:acetylornithine deacetylase/succinyl-diaminopimelate desuccinylase-like protein